jgi:uncharacterized protein
MQEKILKLLDLQKLDIQIRDLRLKQELLEKSLSEEKVHYSSDKEEFEKEKSKLQKIQTDIKRFDIETESLQEKKKKLEAQQAAVKTNQEYKALSKEILDVCAEVDQTDESMIKKMDELDVEKKRLETLGASLKEQEAKLKRDIGVIETDIKSILNEIALLEQKRQVIAPEIDSATIRVYQKVFTRTGGPAIVPVSNRTCGGCHLSITAQVENLTRRNEELILCENCSRILYFKSDEPEDKVEEKT